MGTAVHFKKNQNSHIWSTNISTVASAFPKGIQRSRNWCPEETPKSPAASSAAHLTQSRASCSSPVCSRHLRIYGDEGTTHRDNFQNTEANWTSSPPKGGQQCNCKFGPKLLLVSRLQNLLWVWQQRSKPAFKHQLLKDFQFNCSASGWASTCLNHAPNQM